MTLSISSGPEGPDFVIRISDWCRDEREESSNIMSHAHRELELYGGIGYGQENDAEFDARVLDVLRIFTAMGHSGFSASLFTAITKELMDWKALSPLTDDPAEWMQVSDPDPERHPTGQWQSRRRPDAFSEDGGKTYRCLDEAHWDNWRTWKSPFIWIGYRIPYFNNWLAKKEVYFYDRRQTLGKLHTSVPKVAG